MQFVGITATVGEPLSGEEFERLVEAVKTKLPKISRQALFESMAYMAGEVVTFESIRDMAWRLAGNQRQLKAGLPVPAWTRQQEMEWMPLQIVESHPRRNHREAIGAEYTFRVMAGTACPLRVKKFWTRKQCQFFSTTLGFSKPWGRHPFKDMSEFIGMRLYGLFDPELCLGSPHFDKISVPSSCETHNKSLMQMRARVGFDCPEGFKHPCRQCPIGYQECPAGCHPRSYERRRCDNCNEVKWFDPAHDQECVECHTGKALAPKERR